MIINRFRLQKDNNSGPGFLDFRAAGGIEIDEPDVAAPGKKRRKTETLPPPAPPNIGGELKDVLSAATTAPVARPMPKPRPA